ncbi:MAG TPA: phage holin family protein [Bacteroidales bacterium]|nr:phage holin family protein [Bacteroidales bacterium]
MADKLLLQVQAMTWPAKLFALIVSFLAPLGSLIHVIIALLIADAVTSIYYQMKLAYTNANGEHKLIASFKVIESARLRKSLEKMFFYILMLVLFYSFDVYVLQVEPISADAIHTFSITNISAVLICLVELTSIASNVSKITGNSIFDRIIGLFSKKVNKKFDLDDQDNS